MPRTYRSIDDFLRSEGRTQGWLAEQIGKSQGYISLIRKGERTPSLPVALRLSEICRVPLETLVRRAA